MRSDRSSERPSSPTTPAEAAPDARSGRRRPQEEPEFVNEADIPTDDGPSARGGDSPRDGKRADAKPNPDVRTPPNADVAGVESAAGEEDPGAALDTPPTKRSS